MHRLYSPASLPRSFASPALVLCDPEPGRAAELIAALEPNLSVVHESRLEALERRCQKGAPAAAALPLRWPAKPETTTESAQVAQTPLLQFLQSYGQRLAVVVYSDTTCLPLRVCCQLLAAGARQVLNARAPTFVDDLRRGLCRFLHAHQTHVEEDEQLSRLFADHGLLGSSQALREVFRSVIKASRCSDLPVLMVSETGTGKQRLAEVLHALDPRRCGKPLVTLNCGALTKSLVESTLFGHARGSFSGADSHRLGLFRAANGGTLLLDEVGELDLDVQPKLLRVLQEGRLLPLGDDAEYPIDVRILASTNRPLERMVAEGSFRADLYQRLNVFQIRIPPLRERPEDIEVQARHFLKIHQKDREQPVRDFDPCVLEALRGLPWEGNSRQLENLIREILVHKDSSTPVQMEDLPRWMVKILAHPLPPVAASDSLDTLAETACRQKLSLTEAVEEYERRVLQASLKQNGGNRTRTAAELGLSPRSIFNKIQKYRLG